MKKVYTFFMVIVVVAFFFFSCSGGKNSGKKIYTDQNWEVTLHSIKYENDFKYQSYDGYGSSHTETAEGIVARMSLKYIGLLDAAPPPEIVLLKSGFSETIRPRVREMEGSFYEDPKKETADEANGTAYKETMLAKTPPEGKSNAIEVKCFFDVLNDKTLYKLMVGDIIPIEFTY